MRMKALRINTSLLNLRGDTYTHSLMAVIGSDEEVVVRPGLERKKSKHYINIVIYDFTTSVVPHIKRPIYDALNRTITHYTFLKEQHNAQVKMDKKKTQPKFDFIFSAW